MDLPDHVATQYNIYTLACRGLLGCLDEFRRAAAYQKAPGVGPYILRFNNAVGLLFDSAPLSVWDSVEKAAGYLNNRLTAERDEIKDSSDEAAAVFDKLIDSIAEAAPKWKYGEDVQDLHNVGRDLAKCFYHRSPWETVLDSLGKEGILWFSAQPGVPMSYQPAENRIVVRYSIQHKFSDYLHYLLSFLHEYTAHIFGADLENTIFNDGWMMFVAHEFLGSCKWRTRDKKCFWNPECISCRRTQIDKRHVRVGHERFPNDRQDIAGQGYWIAQNFSRLISDMDFLFWNITWELAAFSPEPGEPDWLVTDFIRKLEAELSSNPIGLRKKLEDYYDFRSLLGAMQPLK